MGGARGPKKPPIRPRKEPRQERAQATVDAILEATAQVLKKIGYDALTTNKVAEAAGVSVGSVYQYFPGKEALLVALMLRMAEKQRVVFVASLARSTDAPIEEAIAGVLESILAATEIDPALSAALMNELPRAGDLGAVMAFNEENTAKPLRAYLASRRHELAVTDIDTAVFLLTHSIQPLLQRIAASRPSPQRRRAIFRELEAMVLGYLVGKRISRARS
jgi:AcrR family transcriptional regulator